MTQYEDQKAALKELQDELVQMPEKDRRQIQELSEEISRIVDRGGQHGHMALALVGLVHAAKE